MNREQIAKAFDNYHWMKRNQDRLLIENLQTDPILRQKLIATYGVEASIPKSKGNCNSAVELEAIDRVEIERIRSLDRNADKIALIESSKVLFTDDDELLRIYELMLEKKKESEIGREMGFSSSTAGRRKEKIIDDVHKMVQMNQMNQMNRMNEMGKVRNRKKRIV